MRFLANENFPGPSIKFLRKKNLDIISIAEDSPGLPDDQVMEIAIREERIILTHDSDYGELIFKNGYKPKEGVVYFRIFDFKAEDPAKILLQLIERNLDFNNRLTVVDLQSIRQRIY